MSLIKSKAFKDMAKTLKLGAQIEQIDTIISMLTKRKSRLNWDALQLIYTKN